MDSKLTELSRLSIGFSSILHRIDSGHYRISTAEHNIRVNQPVDAYSLVYLRWLPGRVVRLVPNKKDAEARVVRVHFDASSEEEDELLPVSHLHSYNSSSNDKVMPSCGVFPMEVTSLVIFSCLLHFRIFVFSRPRRRKTFHP